MGVTSATFGTYIPNEAACPPFLPASSCRPLLTHFSLSMPEIRVRDYALLHLYNFCSPFPDETGMGAWEFL